MKFIAAAALLTVFALPAFAQAPNQIHLEANGLTFPWSEANRDCSAPAGIYSQTTLGGLRTQQYRTCTAQHGRPE
jgi:hypothetical protein